mgnify:FL=1
MRASGIDVVSEHVFADHHAFTASEIAALVAQAKRDGLTLATTEKDLARLQDVNVPAAGADAIVPFPVTLAFDDGPALRQRLAERLRTARRVRVLA